ncbi:hypothetical protein OF83DRAFT_1292608 [Amylostereum chailletii]|nr:hypothetical protein OF83DRAFT_1292608 [Amylostereum chailletii]
MKIVCVDEDHELGKDGLWDIVRDQTVELLRSKNIKLSSVEFVRFTWHNKNDDQGEQEVEDDDKDEDDGEDDGEDDDSQDDGNHLKYEDFAAIKPVEDGMTHYITPPTIWIDVLPDTLHAELAHETARRSPGLSSSTTLSRGPALFGPVGDLDALKDLIDNISTPLSLPIAGLRTQAQGTLGFYFRVGTISTQYVGGPKEVIVMGPPAFDNYVTSIRAKIRTLNDTVIYLETRAASYKRRNAKAEEDGPKAQKRSGAIPKDRIIGYVDWAPPIAVAVASHRYTRDLCAIKLDKKKFKNFIMFLASETSLTKPLRFPTGPEISRERFKALMYDKIDVPSEFHYPLEGLIPLRGMLPAADINSPNSKNLEGELIRRVIKRGSTTLTTVGTLSKFTSHVRKYQLLSHSDSIEVAVAILPHDNDSGPFSLGDDSGSLVVDALHRFAALLTGGTGMNDISHITFATLMELVWDLIKDEYADANLYIEVRKRTHDRRVYFPGETSETVSTERASTIRAALLADEHRGRDGEMYNGPRTNDVDGTG